MARLLLLVLAVFWANAFAGTGPAVPVTTDEQRAEVDRRATWFACTEMYERYYVKNIGNTVLDKAPTYNLEGTSRGAMACVAEAGDLGAKIDADTGAKGTLFPPQGYRMTAVGMLIKVCERNSYVSMFGREKRPTTREEMVSSCIDNAQEWNRSEAAKAKSAPKEGASTAAPVTP